MLHRQFNLIYLSIHLSYISLINLVIILNPLCLFFEPISYQHFLPFELINQSFPLNLSMILND